MSIIHIEHIYEGIGCISAELIHNNRAKGCKQELTTTLRIESQGSAYMSTYSGVNEHGDAWQVLELEGREAVAFAITLRNTLDEFIQAVKDDD